MVDQQRDDRAKHRPKVIEENGAQRKPFTQFVHGDHQSPKPEANGHAQKLAVFLCDEFRPHLADGVTAPSCKASEQDA